MTVDDVTLASLLRAIEKSTAGRPGIESLPTMMRELERSAGALTEKEQPRVLVGLLKAFGEGVGMTVEDLILSLLQSGAVVDGTVLVLDSDAECSCRACTQRRETEKQELN